MMHQNENQQNIGNYVLDLSKLIARGVRGNKYMCKMIGKDDDFCVERIVKRNLDENWSNEKQVLQKLWQDSEIHTNISKVESIKEDEEYFYVVTSLCDMTFDEFLQQKYSSGWFSIDEIYNYVGQLVRGYQYLRQLKIIIRNIQPDDIQVKKLFNNQIILKISNFQRSCISENGFADVRAGMPFFSAPEVSSRNLNLMKNYDSANIYSFGVIMYMMCYKGERPGKIHQFAELNQFYQKLQQQKFQCPENKVYPRDIISMIEKMIAYHPESRLTWDSFGDKYSENFLVLNDLYYVETNKILGSGAQGVTHDAYNLKNREQLVCKIINNRSQGTGREIQIYEQIKKGICHQHVIQVIAIIKQTNNTYLIMEKGDTSLQDYLNERQQQGKKLTDKEVVEFLYQVVDGYIFLKSLGIVHRDLKPENILLKRNQFGKQIIKIIDFGVGKIIGRELTSTEAGTPLYAAPEVLKSNTYYGHTCDIFSLGVMLHYLAFQRMFYDITSRAQLIEIHQALETRPFVCSKHENPLISELINQMIVYDPQKRINWESLHQHKIFDELKYQLNQPIQNTQFVQSTTTQILQIYQYIWAVRTLSLKCFYCCDEVKQGQTLYDELFIIKKFLLKFRISCLMAIEKLDKHKEIELDGNCYQIQSVQDFKNWYNRDEIKKEVDQQKEQYSSLNQISILNNSQIYSQGLQELSKLDQSICQNQNFTFLDINFFFKTFYNRIRLDILKSEYSLRLKCSLERFLNVFTDFPLKDFQSFSELSISFKIYQVVEMQDYIKQQRDKIYF